jgi:tRNA dimethylallyltransferase
MLDCWYLTGATASGKTTVGMALAKLLGAEIISLDSMAVYRGMDIGTAKPTPQQRREVPHHLVDILDADQEFSVNSYLSEAARAAADIRSRGKEVLFVGGSPLYLKALLRGIFTGPPADWSFRNAVLEEVKQVGVAALHQRLRQIDPVAASRLPPADVRRIIRALEVYRGLGQPISHLQLQFEEGMPADRCRVFVLDWPRAVLHRRIDARVASMFDQGLVDEVRTLTNRFGRLSRTASQAVGYREVQDYLNGRRSLEETVEKVKTRTRRFAKRQGTWYRSLSECRFVRRMEGDSAEAVARQLLAAGAELGAHQ